VWRGVEGYGASSRIHTSRILDLAEHLPVPVMVIDEAARLRRFVEQNSEVLAPVDVALSEVEIWQPGPGTGR
jgi:PII-like signaling protein